MSPGKRSLERGSQVILTNGPYKGRVGEVIGLGKSYVTIIPKTYSGTKPRISVPYDHVYSKQYEIPRPKDPYAYIKESIAYIEDNAYKLLIGPYKSYDLLIKPNWIWFTGSANIEEIEATTPYKIRWVVNLYVLETPLLVLRRGQLDRINSLDRKNTVNEEEFVKLHPNYEYDLPNCIMLDAWNPRDVIRRVRRVFENEYMRKFRRWQLWPFSVELSDLPPIGYSRYIINSKAVKKTTFIYTPLLPDDLVKLVRIIDYGLFDDKVIVTASRK